MIFLPFSSLRAFLSFDSAIVEKNDKEPGGKEGAKARAREGAEGARHQVRRRRGREREEAKGLGGTAASAHYAKRPEEGSLKPLCSMLRMWTGCLDGHTLPSVEAVAQGKPE